MNTSLLAGLGVGSGIVVLGLVGASLLMPPPQDQPAPPAAPEIAAEPATELPEPETIATTEPEPEMDAPEPVATDLTALPDDETDQTSPAEDDAGTVEAPSPSAVTDAPAETQDLATDEMPVVPTGDADHEQARLPAGALPVPGSDSGVTRPDTPTPPNSDGDTPVAGEAPANDTDDAVSVAGSDRAALPDPRRPSLPQINTGDSAPEIANAVPAPDAAAVTALERNALFQGDRSGARMALVLSDPGLPMAMRRSLAAMDFPFTIALNPLDTTAPEAAAIYREAGKEVLILATSIPDGATASDLDVTFGAFFGALPMAVGVIDLPQGGFARNARLLNEILPLLRDDGHGLVTFSGGLSQATRAAEAAGVPHAEVFRIIDSGNDSAFTMRRFLDRAVFQASQMGQVIVFGDASNDVLMEAIEMWRTGRTLDQVALVQISGVLGEP
ncbi:MAG: divergent polysaccharide deacetylase family protein [Roseinatronobacter sp.]